MSYAASAFCVGFSFSASEKRRYVFLMTYLCCLIKPCKLPGLFLTFNKFPDKTPVFNSLCSFLCFRNEKILLPWYIYLSFLRLFWLSPETLTFSQFFVHSSLYKRKTHFSVPETEKKKSFLLHSTCISVLNDNIECVFSADENSLVESLDYRAINTQYNSISQVFWWHSIQLSTTHTIASLDLLVVTGDHHS